MTEIIKTFRHPAAFGKRMEYFVIGQMLKEGLDVFIPMIDDDAIDAVIKKPDGTYVEIQIKARSKTNQYGSAALFAAIEHSYRPNYWFVFFSERMNMMWIMSSAEFLKESYQNKDGKNIGKHRIQLNGTRKGCEIEPVNTKYIKYIANDFSRILYDNPSNYHKHADLH
jgi:hypothetical protein